MIFSKEHIFKFKRKEQSYISWRTNLKPIQIQEYFYNDDKKYHINVLFPGKNLEHFRCRMYNIVCGDFQLGLKYVNEEGTFYMFLSANTSWAYPQNVAIGKAVDGTIYLIQEYFPGSKSGLTFKEIPEAYIGKEEWKVPSYTHDLDFFPIFGTKSEDITDEDVKCLQIAYEGVRAFSKLIKSTYSDHN